MKNWWESRSIWAAIFSGGAATAALIASTAGIGLTAQHVAILMLVSNMLALWMRLITTEPIRGVGSD